MSEAIKGQPGVGELVRANIPAILAYCESSPAELALLTDGQRSKDTFGINWPLLKRVSDMSEGEHIRYWTAIYEVGGGQYRATSQWYPQHRAPFLAYLASRGLATPEEAAAVALAAEEQEKQQLVAAAVSKARYKGVAIGNAQNLFVRTLLSNLGTESFTKTDWDQVRADFGNLCAYCQEQPAAVMDHAIPINRVSLGEHRLGNLVPACHPCNSSKGKKDFREFAAEDPATIARIEAHMARHRYEPLGDNEQVRLFLETAYKEVRELSQRYLLLLNSLTLDSSTAGAGQPVASAGSAEELESARRLVEEEPEDEYLLDDLERAAEELEEGDRLLAEEEGQ